MTNFGCPSSQRRRPQGRLHSPVQSVPTAAKSCSIYERNVSMLSQDDEKHRNEELQAALLALAPIAAGAQALKELAGVKAEGLASARDVEARFRTEVLSRYDGKKAIVYASRDSRTFEIECRRLRYQSISNHCSSREPKSCTAKAGRLARARSSSCIRRAMSLQTRGGRGCRWGPTSAALERFRLAWCRIRYRLTTISGHIPVHNGSVPSVGGE